MQIQPGSPEWLQIVSPSKVAAICGVSRWQSPYGLWCTMKGWVQPEPPKDIFVTGHAFEHALAALWKEENPGWTLSRGEVQYRSTEFGFPCVATIDRRATKNRRQRILEIKIARDLSAWGDPNLDGDCPADYLLQVIAQQAFSGLTSKADLAVMGPYFEHRTYGVAHDEPVANWMIGQCATFYDSLQYDTPPELDNSTATYETVRKLHPDIEYGEHVEIPEALYMDIASAKIAAKQAETELRGLKIKLLDTLGQAQFATVNGEVVADRRPHGRGGVALNVR